MSVCFIPSSYSSLCPPSLPQPPSLALPEENIYLYLRKNLVRPYTRKNDLIYAKSLLVRVVQRRKKTGKGDIRAYTRDFPPTSLGPKAEKFRAINYCNKVPSAVLSFSVFSIPYTRAMKKCNFLPELPLEFVISFSIWIPAIPSPPAPIMPFWFCYCTILLSIPPTNKTKQNNNLYFVFRKCLSLLSDFLRSGGKQRSRAEKKIEVGKWEGEKLENKINEAV